MSTTNTCIRRATTDEVSLVSGLIRDSFRDVAKRFQLTPHNCPKHPSNCTDRWVQDDFARGVTYYVLQLQGRAAGCVALEKPDSDICYLERLAVLPENRRRGLGRLLVTHIFAEAKAAGAREVSIGIIAEQAELKAWYGKMGFLERETKTFEHLPFHVTFMVHRF